MGARDDEARDLSNGRGERSGERSLRLVLPVRTPQTRRDGGTGAGIDEGSPSPAAGRRTQGRILREVPRPESDVPPAELHAGSGVARPVQYPKQFRTAASGIA